MNVYQLFGTPLKCVSPYEGFWQSREQAEMAGEMSGVPYGIYEIEVLG
jgi:hypothetical protein